MKALMPFLMLMVSYLKKHCLWQVLTVRCGKYYWIVVCWTGVRFRQQFSVVSFKV